MSYLLPHCVRFRLGVLSGLEVLQHPWLSGVNWDGLQVNLLPETLSVPQAPIAEVGGWHNQVCYNEKGIFTLDSSSVSCPSLSSTCISAGGSSFAANRATAPLHAVLECE